jgi:hypothetical protein
MNLSIICILMLNLYGLHPVISKAVAKSPALTGLGMERAPGPSVRGITEHPACSTRLSAALWAIQVQRTTASPNDWPLPSCFLSTEGGHTQWEVGAEGGLDLANEGYFSFMLWLCLITWLFVTFIIDWLLSVLFWIIQMACDSWVGRIWVFHQIVGTWSFIVVSYWRHAYVV